MLGVPPLSLVNQTSVFSAIPRSLSPCPQVTDGSIDRDDFAMHMRRDSIDHPQERLDVLLGGFPGTVGRRIPDDDEHRSLFGDLRRNVLQRLVNDDFRAVALKPFNGAVAAKFESAAFEAE